MKFEFTSPSSQDARIKVIGVGGGGGNAIKHMLANQEQLEDIEFICINTDSQALISCNVKTILQIGEKTTKGLGAAANPSAGRQAALENKTQLTELLKDTDMVFIVAGMGGGTGTGATPVIAQIAQELGILTIAIVTEPFGFEGAKRKETAQVGIKELLSCADSVIVFPNEKLLSEYEASTSLLSAFEKTNETLLQAVKSVSDLINKPGMINADFTDVRTIMTKTGLASLGSGFAGGANRAKTAVMTALNDFQLNAVDLKHLGGLLVNITAGMDLTLGEYSEVGDAVSKAISDDATVVIGTVIDPSMRDQIKVTIIATGITKQQAAKPTPSVNVSLDYMDISKIRIITPENTPEDKIVELIINLSNVYKSVGGDEFVIDDIKIIPPDAMNASRKKHAAG